MLSLSGVKTRYGRIKVLHGVELEVEAGEIVTVVGANGAGKTTLLRCLSGLQPLTAGRVVFDGRDITGLAAHRRVPLGLAQSPEGRQIFTNLSVEDNLRLGAFHYSDAKVGQDRDEVYALFPVLREKRHLPAGGLSGGQQQMLAIGRALMSRPRCLLLDEPSMGLAPLLVKQVLGVVADLKRRGITVLLVEQNAMAALAIADRGYVMETGRIVTGGPAQALMTDPAVREAYLGV